MFSCAISPEEVESDLERHGLEAAEFALPIQLPPIPADLRRNVVEAGRRLRAPFGLHEVITLTYANRDAAVVSRIRERVEEDLRLAGESGARWLTLHTTCTRTAQSLESIWRADQTLWLARSLDQDVTPDFNESVNALVELLDWACPKAADCGVMIAVENNFREPRMFSRRIDGIADLMAVLERVDSPAVGVCFDIYKSYTTESSIGEAIRRCGSRIVDVHASDIRHTDTGFFTPRYPLGEGLIDWHEALGALLSVGYEGAIILEMLKEAAQIEASRAYFDAVCGDLENQK